MIPCWLYIRCLCCLHVASYTAVGSICIMCCIDGALSLVLLCCVHSAAMFVCVCVLARMFVCASVGSFGCQLVSLCSVMLCPCFSFVWFLVLCCMLTTSNRTPPPCHLLAAVLESKGRFSSNGNRRSDAGRPYTFWPSLQTHISRTVNGARDRRAPWM